MTTVRLSSVNSAIDSSGIDPAKKAEIKEAVRNATTPLPDTWIYRIVVLALGLAIFVPLAGLFAGDTANASKELVQMLLPIATAALGALAGLLAPSPAANG
ncbi:MAG: hypothetical protein QOH81_1277 [Sphingomonadales bacterium]|jgi:hypothetical protein|nr:hypothetical protein [Sphingomonadales bacterium]